MKTLIITLEYPPQAGGIASYVYNFAAHLPVSDVVVYAPRLKGDKEFDAKQGWKVYRRQPHWLLWPRWIRMLFQILEIIKKEKIEHLYIHQALPAGYVGLLLKKFKKLPYTIFLHGTDVTLAVRSAWKLKRFRQVLAGAERVVVNSNFLKNKVEGKLENLKTPVEVLYPSPADDFFIKTPEEIVRKLKTELALNGKRVMLTVARMVEGKGYPHIAHMLPELVRRVPNLAWLIIGDGPKKAELVGLIQKNHLQNVVRLLGVVPREELPKYYQLADLFVLLTHADESQEEAWGTVFLEAAASGLPVVAGRAGGVEEAVENSVTGAVVDIYQEKAVIETIVGLLENTEQAGKMGQAGQERVMNEFTWEKQLLRLKD